MEINKATPHHGRFSILETNVPTTSPTATTNTAATTITIITASNDPNIDEWTITIRIQTSENSTTSQL
jgi:hypothetical protein